MTTSQSPRSLPALATARGVTVTWWYTASAVVFFELVVVLTWATTLGRASISNFSMIWMLVGGLVWILSTLPLLRAYRLLIGDPSGVQWRSTIVPLAAAIAYGVLALALSGLWMLAVVPVAQSLQLLDWPKMVRTRLVVAVTLVLAGLWVIDVNVAGVADPFVVGFLSVSLPIMTVLSLWWWDVLISLDRARVSESRLAATQERLNVATDVHDLQGHHLQVIALQLELTERLLRSDPDAALEQLKAARVSVDEARQGTRDLATRFRSVPLRDELANARDLLRAAGIAASASIAPDADQAPAAVFGPVIRETTTNVLRHGGGEHASLELTLDGGLWRYSISNDMDAAAAVTGHGTGLDGIARRAEEAGGTLDVVRGSDTFTVTVTAPAR